MVVKRLAPGGGLFLSLSGLESALGETYTALDQPLTQRWGSLGETEQEKFAITQKLCLYTPSEVESLLSSLKDFRPEGLWVSEFGNIKAYGRKVEI